jgi:hypothetical protein
MRFCLKLGSGLLLIMLMAPARGNIQVTGWTSKDLSSLPESSPRLASLLEHEPLLILVRSRMVFLSGTPLAEAITRGYSQFGNLALPLVTGNVNFSNNVIRYPNGSSPFGVGRRFWVNDIFWADLSPANEKQVSRQAGLEAQFYVDPHQNLSLRQLSFCQTIASCERLGIPFRQSNANSAGETWSESLIQGECDAETLLVALWYLPLQDTVYRFALARLLKQIGDSDPYSLMAPLDVPQLATPNDLETQQIQADARFLYRQLRNLRLRSDGQRTHFDCIGRLPEEGRGVSDLRRVVFLRAKAGNRFAGVRVEYLRNRSSLNLLPIKRSLVSLVLCLSQEDCKARGIMGAGNP